jgi:hypothetical protein
LLNVFLLLWLKSVQKFGTHLPEFETDGLSVIPMGYSIPHPVFKKFDAEELVLGTKREDHLYGGRRQCLDIKHDVISAPPFPEDGTQVANQKAKRKNLFLLRQLQVTVGFFLIVPPRHKRNS